MDGTVAFRPPYAPVDGTVSSTYGGGVTSTRRPTGAAVLQTGVTDSITSAAVRELEEVGYARLSMERVARAAGVGKSAIYRRWPSKLAMVVDLLAAISLPATAPLGTGAVRADVRTIVDGVLDWLTEPRMRRLLPDLMAEAARNPELAAATERHIAEPRRAWAETVLRSAPYAEQVSPSTMELVLDLLAAPLYWRTVHRRPVDDAYLDALTAVITRCLEPAERPH